MQENECGKSWNTKSEPWETITEIIGNTDMRESQCGKNWLTERALGNNVEIMLEIMRKCRAVGSQCGKISEAKRGPLEIMWK